MTKQDETIIHADYEQAMEYRRAYLAQQQAFHQFALRAQTEFSKWLLASLLFLHTSALGAILFKTPAPATKAAVYFVIGVVFAIACGFVGWMNYNYLVELTGQQSDPRILVIDDQVAEYKDRWKIPATFYASVILGLGSIAAWIIGALLLL